MHSQFVNSANKAIEWLHIKPMYACDTRRAVPFGVMLWVCLQFGCLCVETGRIW